MTCTGSPPDRGEARFVANRVVVALGCGALLIAPFVWLAALGEEGPILCALRAATGLPCPGCGLTRAFCAISKFDVARAAQLNVLSLPLYALVVVAPFVALYEIVRRRRSGWWGLLYSPRLARWSAGTVAVYHLGRVAVWAVDGTLLNTYFRSGLLYRLFASLHGGS